METSIREDFRECPQIYTHGRERKKARWKKLSCNRTSSRDPSQHPSRNSGAGTTLRIASWWSEGPFLLFSMPADQSLVQASWEGVTNWKRRLCYWGDSRKGWTMESSQALKRSLSFCWEPGWFITGLIRKINWLINIFTGRPTDMSQ